MPKQVQFFGGVFLCPKYPSCVPLSQACFDYLLMIEVWTDKEVLYESVFLLQVFTLDISKCNIIALWENEGLLLHRAENVPRIFVRALSELAHVGMEWSWYIC